MIVVLLTAVASICAIAIARYFAVKTRLAEKSIDEAIAKRLAASSVMSELRDLRELNRVMRNLLIDLVEAEDIKPQGPSSRVSPNERKRLYSMREERRREIYAETLVLLRHTNASRDRTAVG